ncbi:MAG TPA: hypothetical protein VFX97_16705 [Pyrinomonadaceae bacterium]|nr:hypothetical protein [Pyrinomonadaceae bacterium]
MAETNEKIVRAKSLGLGPKLESVFGCKECRPYHTTHGPRHQVTCPTLTDSERMEWWKARYYEIEQTVRKDASRHTQAALKWNERITFWQGKFAAVKHENNKLRRKLQRVDPLPQEKQG